LSSDEFVKDDVSIGVYGQFFLGGGAELSLPEKFFDSAQKTAMLTCKITLPNSPHPEIISKNPGFWALYFARQNEFRFFRLISTKKYFFSFLAAGFCPKNLAFVRKIMVLPESGGLHRCSPLAPWLVRLWMCRHWFLMSG